MFERSDQIFMGDGWSLWSRLGSQLLSCLAAPVDILSIFTFDVYQETAPLFTQRKRKEGQLERCVGPKC